MLQPVPVLCVAAPWGRRSRCGCPMIPKPFEVVLSWSSRSPRCTLFCWRTSSASASARLGAVLAVRLVLSAAGLLLFALGTGKQQPAAIDKTLSRKVQ